jgi:hypothetical protein
MEDSWQITRTSFPRQTVLHDGSKLVLEHQHALQTNKQTKSGQQGSSEMANQVRLFLIPWNTKFCLNSFHRGGKVCGDLTGGSPRRNGI